LSMRWIHGLKKAHPRYDYGEWSVVLEE